VKGTVAIVPGMKCGRCGGPVFITKACCNLRAKGWVTMVKCLRGDGWRKAYQRASSHPLVPDAKIVGGG
jgi:hypothetical protein